MGIHGDVEGVTWGYKGLQGVTVRWSYKGLEGVTWGYMGLRRVTGVFWEL